MSLVGGVLSWAVLVLALVFGGLDPSPTRAPLLQVATLGALLVSVLALCLAIVALVRGPQRAAAAFGLVSSLLFLLYFTGVGFAVVGLLR
jgi:hypothetical protein